MKSRIFRSLIRSVIAASLPLSLPLSLQSGCGTCADTATSEFSATANVRARLAMPNVCENYCGVGASVCSIVVSGQSPLAIDCNGMSPKSPPSGPFSVQIQPADCAMVCDGGAATCEVRNDHFNFPGKNVRMCNTTRVCTQNFTAVEGRRPADLQLADCAADSDIGAFFAEACQLEAASVTAFAILADELAAHGAPPELVAAARKAEHDEVRHTRMTAALAQRFAAQPGEPIVTRSAVRPLFAIALENSVEGCVREAFGAFQASFQGAKATDARVRKTMAHIAHDEIRHAELAFAVAAWITPLLSADERARVTLARQQALAALLHQVAQPLSPSLLTTAGLPPAEASLSFLHAHALLLA